jgi:hypothetical protein
MQKYSPFWHSANCYVVDVQILIFSFLALPARLCPQDSFAVSLCSGEMVKDAREDADNI